MSVIIITGGGKAKQMIDAIVAASENSQLSGEQLCTCQDAVDTLIGALEAVLLEPPMDQPPPGP